MINILTKKTEFNYSLHGLRGLASLLVYIAHSCDGFREHMCNKGIIEPILLHLYYLGSFGVEIFFFLSGYVIFSASLKADLKNFAAHRIWRIYPVFIFFTVLYFVLNHFIQREPWKDSFSILITNGFFLNLFLNTPALSPNAWTITYEVWFYIMTFALLRPIVLKKMYIISFIALILWGYFIWKHPISLYYVMGMLTNIFLRKECILSHKQNSNIINTIQYISLFITIFLAAASDYRYHWEYMNNARLWILLIAFNIFMVTLFHQPSTFTRFLSRKSLLFFGTISYSLYLTHPYSYLIARMTAQNFMAHGVYFEMASLIYIMLNLALTVVFVFFIFKFIENKMYKFGTGKTIYTPVSSPVTVPQR
ncbi:MAG: acyltransferase [Chlorobium sp.]|nr:acyltransferase [Chlorobium sp.]